MTEAQKTFLITGLPGSFLAQKLLPQLLLKHPTAQLKCLVADALLERAEHAIQRLPESDQARVELVRGDVHAMDFGMSGARFVALAQQIDVIHHCVCANYGGVGHEAERRVFVGSTGEVLELALASQGRLQRLVHWSSALLAMPTGGRLSETEWRRPPSFRSRSDEMRWRAEVLIRDGMNRVPITILRPTILVGDSKSGEIDRLEGPYGLFQLLLSSPLELPVPGRGEQPFPLVPIDYVLEAGLAIADDPRSAGRTFHLSDECPLSVRRVFELISEASDRPSTAPSLPRNLAALLLHAPRLERLSQVPRPFLELLACDVAYDARNTRELLAGTGIECPNLASYLKTILARVRREQLSLGKPRRARRHPHFEEMEDPLDV
jgi:nucleoside-diphosphate-sugar epimerase